MSLSPTGPGSSTPGTAGRSLLHLGSIDGVVSAPAPSCGGRLGWGVAPIIEIGVFDVPYWPQRRHDPPPQPAPTRGGGCANDAVD